MQALAVEPPVTDAPSGTAGTLQTLSRGLSVIEALAASPSERGMTQAALARRLGMQRSTLYRYLASLQELGFIEASGDARYRLGPRILVLAAAGLRERSFPRYARRYVDELARITEETAHATIFDHGHAVTIELADGSGPIGPRISIGARRPAHLSASGKVFLAHGEPEVRDRYLQRPLEGMTDSSITEPAALRLHLDEVRARGYATDRSEYIAGISCMAAPVFDSRGKVVGAFSVSVVAHDLDADLLARLGRPLLMSARACSKHMGAPDA